MRFRPIIYLSVYACLILILSHQSRCIVTIKENGYAGVVVAISENIVESDYPTLVSDLIQNFINASSYLYTATRNRAFFKNVTILIPATWQDKVTYQAATSQSFDSADFRIDLVPGHTRATTVGVPGCGMSGQYILIPPQRFQQVKAPPYRMIVHEWAHYRYGVFDEYAVSPSQLGFIDGQGNINENKCTAQIEGGIIDIITGKKCNYPYGSNCVYSVTNGKGSKGSIMFDQNIDSVNTFCDTDNSNPLTYHNAFALNNQNLYCLFQSTWTVIMRHQDFTNNNNPARQIDITVPNIRIVRRKDIRTVLVLDTSGSMQGVRLQQMRLATTNFILNSAVEGEFLGIVSFNSRTTIMSSLTKIVDQNVKNNLIAQIPSAAVGLTSVGGGLLSALNMLKSSVNQSFPCGGRMIVLSDGEENVGPYISSVINDLVSNQIIVHTVSLGSSASERLQNVSYSTGGKAIYAPSGDIATLNSAFLSISQQNAAGDGSQAENILQASFEIMVQSESLQLSAFGIYYGNVYIDESIGNDTAITILWDVQPTTLVVTSPSGDDYNTSSQTGIWRYKIQAGGNQKRSIQTIAISVTSRPSTSSKSSNPLTSPVTASIKIDQASITYPQPVLISVNVQKNYFAVLNASVYVSIIPPSKTTSEVITLNDQGAGADLVKNDGIYSGYYTNFISNGRYSVQARVNASQDQAYILTAQLIGIQDNQDGSNTTSNQLIHLPSFTRVTSGNLFQVTNYVQGIDKIPPARVHDLQANTANVINFTMLLTWTAPGDNMDTGRASRYEIRYSLNYTIFTSNFSSGQLVTSDFIVNSGNSMRPRLPGILEELQVAIPNAKVNETYSFALITYDNSANVAQVSNYALATFTKITTPPQINSDLIINISVGIGCGIVGIILLTVIGIFLVRKYSTGKSTKIAVISLQA
ncbi:uncharacterized protein TRIADDRAFT_57368 [Trichoplax adhaerens]|uniref:VWFA domain-containing protein n=1 Tax=Trichoplax adhaerens TaxID=10228 RepID=B3RZ90_TRIAD|nr:hypothetical protein TRIADDRAFT_57368 [Trichoplax adhaerens]EDV24161.1 hypothetical protein TRIADDRAFT_57368 [Trichoplax adhaerens]|eukprot:XP_002113687.1 hypothetical protein TRIADDRAFT_57368 [Trichoplax adhaerens]